MARDVAWYQKLGCDQDPFSPNPAVDDFYFETPALASHLNTLTSVASKGEFIGLVKGDRGIGKTSLLNQMARRFRDDPDVAFTRVTCTDNSSLIQSLGISSGLTEEELAVEPRKVLIEHLTRLRTGGQKVVAAIDDAHLLSPQDLAMLIRIGLSPNASGLVHTILFAEADIEARLWLSAINDPLPLDRLYTLILTPLGAEQTPAYLTHRLGAAGLEKVSFSASEAAAIHRRSEGMPAAINEQAGLRLERRYGPVWSRGLGAVQRFRPAWAAGLAGVALLAGLAVWQREPLGNWAASLDLELPWAEDPTGTEVAIAIPGQAGDPPDAASTVVVSEGSSPSQIAPVPGLTGEEPEVVVAVDPVRSGEPDGTAGEPPMDLVENAVQAPADPAQVVALAEDVEADTEIPAAEVVALAGDTTPDAASPLNGPPPLPQSLQERLAERERERQQAEAGEIVALVEVPSDSPETTPTDAAETLLEALPPALSRPPALSEFPRLAGVGEPNLPAEVAVATPVTPETPTTPITGRDPADAATGEEASGPSVVRPRPRPEVPLVEAAPIPAVEAAVADAEPEPEPEPENRSLPLPPSLRRRWWRGGFLPGPVPGPRCRPHRRWPPPRRSRPLLPKRPRQPSRRWWPGPNRRRSPRRPRPPALSRWARCAARTGSASSRRAST